jgi:hypothetical protein
MPPVRNRFTDVEIPQVVWSSWQEMGKRRQLRRALTAEERTALELRRDEIAPVLISCSDREMDRITLAISDMFGGFPSMHMRDDESVVGRVDAVRRLLARFPAWAIVKACTKIHMDGVWRNGAFDRQWPPSDAEIVDAVREAMRLYADTHRTMVALLEAEVEER